MKGATGFDRFSFDFGLRVRDPGSPCQPPGTAFKLPTTLHSLPDSQVAVLAGSVRGPARTSTADWSPSSAPGQGGETSPGLAPKVTCPWVVEGRDPDHGTHA
jgi:hypothetical protein